MPDYDLNTLRDAARQVVEASGGLYSVVSVQADGRIEWRRAGTTVGGQFTSRDESEQLTRLALETYEAIASTAMDDPRRPDIHMAALQRIRNRLQRTGRLPRDAPLVPLSEEEARGRPGIRSTPEQLERTRVRREYQQRPYDYLRRRAAELRQTFAERIDNTRRYGMFTREVYDPNRAPDETVAETRERVAAEQAERERRQAEGLRRSEEAEWQRRQERLAARSPGEVNRDEATLWGYWQPRLEATSHWVSQRVAAVRQRRAERAEQVQQERERAQAELPTLPAYRQERTERGAVRYEPAEEGDEGPHYYQDPRTRRWMTEEGYQRWQQRQAPPGAEEDARAQLRRRRTGGWGTALAIGAATGAVVSMSLATIQGVMGDLLGMAFESFGASGQAVMRIGQSIVDVIARSLKGIATAGAVVIGGVLGLIFGPAVAVALGAVMGGLAAALGAVAAAVGKLFGDALQSAKAVLDDVIGAATRFAEALMRIHWATGMTVGSAAGLTLTLDALGISAQQAESLFGQWAMRLEFLAPRLAMMGVALTRNADGTIDWAFALSQLRQRFMELPDIMRIPYLTATVGPQAAQALLPIMHMPEPEFRAGADRAREAQHLAGLGERVVHEYGPVRQRLRFIVQMIKLEVAQAALPWVTELLRTVEDLWAQYREVILAFVRQIPAWIGTGWNVVIEMVQKFLRLLPDVVDWLARAANVGRVLANVLIRIINALDRMLGGKGGAPLLPPFLPPREGGEEGKSGEGPTRGFAAGGYIPPGGGGITGEYGPETVYAPPGGGAMIIPDPGKPVGLGPVAIGAVAAPIVWQLLRYLLPILGRALARLLPTALLEILRRIAPHILPSLGVAAAGGLLGGLLEIRKRRKRAIEGYEEETEAPPAPDWVDRLREGANEAAEAIGRLKRPVPGGATPYDDTAPPFKFIPEGERRAGQFGGGFLGMLQAVYAAGVEQKQRMEAQRIPQRHEVRLLMPPSLMSEVAALEVAENVRLIFANTVS